MVNKTLYFSLFVFLGGCSYGVLSTFVKKAYEKGFVFQDVIQSQFFFGWVLLLLLMLLFSRNRVTKKQMITLMLVGITTSLTGMFYYLSLQTIQASLAIILLFQFTWVGVLIESIVNRTLPSKEKVISVIILFIGTLLSGGFFGSESFYWEKNGVFFGLCSAITFALFIFFSGRVETNVPTITRSFMMTSGALLFLFIILTPSFLINGSLSDGLWLYGVPLGVFGVVLPVIFFAYGAPKINSGLATILGASELPVAVIMSMLVLHEAVTFLQWVGVFIILVGIALPQFNVLKKQPLQV
ncbi:MULTISPECIES: EamA family transporter [Sutcliffiella]|uniref:EamA family transporter n=1 Tax=Sutcliffiella cohnii TaxID=33932 RepID=A0A223KM24_9BACI|nr:MULTISPECIES: DMT family transporter [Sutcliffiella]AST90414.1 EamA family transporter [Sutcliffiella cohnii]MED4017470.1 DMT family transporter [Sutcliffiella cohnii]WBL16068.1 DMT family transporter [Sutcliffiella sp. NC1]